MEKAGLKNLFDRLSAHLDAECKSRGLASETLAANSDGLVTAIEVRALREGWKTWSMRHLYAVALALDVEIPEFLLAAGGEGLETGPVRGR